MALLQLQIDVDGDAHPELHAVLALIAREPARAERLRQLAAAGLIWEQLRSQARSLPAAVPVAAAAAAPIATDVPIATSARIVPPGTGQLRPSNRASGTAPRGHIPVLSDVIDEAVLPLPSHAAEAQDDGAVHLDFDLKVDRHEPAAPPARQRGVRPRLLKMKEKGLFSNGPQG